MEIYQGAEEDKDDFIQKALKVFKTCKVKCLKTPRLDAPAKKTAYNLFWKNMRETNEKLKGATISKVSAIISKEWKKVKASDMKMKKYRDLYEVEKQRYEKDLQRYQEDPMDEKEMINLHEICNKTETKRVAKAKSRTSAKTESKRGANTASKATWSGCHLFLKGSQERISPVSQ